MLCAAGEVFLLGVFFGVFDKGLCLGVSADLCGFPLETSPAGVCVGSDYSKIRKYVYSSSGNKHPTAAGEDCILAIALMYR